MVKKFNKSELEDLVKRSRALRIERQSLLDRLWILEEESHKLQNDFFRIVGTEEVGFRFKVIDGVPEVTGIEVEAK